MSLNRAAILMMRRGAGLVEPSGPANTVGDALDGFIGSWSAAEARSVLKSIATLEQIDPDLWR